METAQYNITNDRLFFWPEEGTRLPQAEYDAAKAAGLTWWPRGCFTCVWRVSAEDWILNRGIEIVADDTPDDVESRVNRYSGYASKAEAEAGWASKRAAEATTDRKFERSSRVALREAETAAHWQSRIAGAVARIEHHDSYTTCQNRVKGLEADKRKQERGKAESEKWISTWENLVIDLPTCRRVSDADYAAYYWDKVNGRERFTSTLLESGEITWEAVKAKAIAIHQNYIESNNRWIAHLEMRLEYERAYAAAIHGDKILEKQPRRVSAAPADGLKRGMKVRVYGQASSYLNAPQTSYETTILSLGPLTVTVACPPERLAKEPWNAKGIKIRRATTTYSRIEVI